MEERSVIRESAHLPRELSVGWVQGTVSSVGRPPLPPRPRVPSEPATWPRPPSYEPGTTTTCIRTRSQHQDYRSELLEAGPAAAARASRLGPTAPASGRRTTTPGMRLCRFAKVLCFP